MSPPQIEVFREKLALKNAPPAVEQPEVRLREDRVIFFGKIPFQVKNTVMKPEMLFRQKT